MEPLEVNAKHEYPSNMSGLKVMTTRPIMTI